MTKVLVTGAGGFSGKALISFLQKSEEFNIVASDIAGVESSSFRLCELSRIDAAESLLEEVSPAHIYHLAGSFTNNYELDYSANVLTSKNVLDACLKINLKAKLLLIGSAAEYGIISAEDNPVSEKHVLNPLSIYGLTKLYQTSLMQYYHRVYGCNVLMARPFNILGKGQSDNLFAGRVYEEIAKFKRGEITHITLGNLQNKRDYFEINNVVHDYALIMKHGTPGEIYNVASGKSIKVCDLLKQILHENGLTMDIVSEKAMSCLHKFDVKDIFADITKIQALRQLVSR